VSRWAGIKPASEILRRSSVSLVRFSRRLRIRHFPREGAADIVGAELQTNLADFDARVSQLDWMWSKLSRLQTADGKRLQIIDGGGLLIFLPSAVFSAANTQG